MSYEGYEVHYCENGHRIRYADAYDSYYDDERTDPCPVCGSTTFYCDYVDQTNGCQCEYVFPEMFPDFKGGMADLNEAQTKEMEESCGAHETVDTVSSWSPVPCSSCDGSGTKKIVKRRKPEPCPVCKEFGEKNSCDLCKGSGYVMVPSEWIDGTCPDCEGRGHKYAEVWDISKLKAKRYENES